MSSLEGSAKMVVGKGKELSDVRRTPLPANRFIAFLRGINISGNKTILMKALAGHKKRLF